MSLSRLKLCYCSFMMLQFIAIVFLTGGREVFAHSNYQIEPVDIFFEPPVKRTISNLPQFEKSKNMSCGDLNIDESCIIINSNVDFVVNFLYQSMECVNCSMLALKPLKPHSSQELVLKLASLGTVWGVSDEANKTICGLNTNYLGENSWYHIDINETGCSLVCDKEPEPTYYPVIIALAIYIVLFTLWALGGYLYRSMFFDSMVNRSSLDDLAAAFSSSTTIDDKKQKPTQNRLRSLDTVRGISIVVMIFVNYGGGRYWYFEHAHWNGLTVADLVFPWFIWMMGMSMAFSLKSQLRKVVSKKKIFFKIFKRSVILFALGLMLNTLCLNVNLKELRILGVLQRFGVSYFVVATVHLFYASADDTSQSYSAFRDIISYGGEWLIMLSFLTTHILLMYLVHPPDCPTGYFGPGGLHDQGAYFNCTGGAAGYIDRIILGPSHLYQNPGSKAIYHSTLPYDPEGILGYFTSIFLVFLGLQAGKILLMFKEPKARLARWMIWSVVTGSIAGILCNFSKNDGWIPVNKNLWSVSFILATASLAFTLLSICYAVNDVYKFWNGGPFYHAGMNSIMLYVGHSITHNMFPWRWQVHPTHMNELFMNLWGTSLWVIIAVWMHRKNVFVTI
ncbi:heparan-alpha-glucosaminide N-acetyltransferase [Trichonephila inaurata madagascariensis]|uniref:Heparan-alpha-glucosaminide N-acetyltransferase n=1 Tax=Trichonephila inaurata madagascariensis TaxID=2747483 RepID=A0A8X6XK98_9ARAC|nr:heparan-alpha-glucosaminide N-acetyltransferase [Trichonephila inaurata madagascariensis]